MNLGALLVGWLLCTVLYCWLADRTPTEPLPPFNKGGYIPTLMPSAKEVRAEMRAQIIDELVADWSREIECCLDDVVEEWAS